MIARQTTSARDAAGACDGGAAAPSIMAVPDDTALDAAVDACRREFDDWQTQI
jgi:hypothetical protein